jgi:two-component sensor histidine kinase
MTPAPRRSVLIAEDDPGVAELVRERLEAIGCDCEIAASGRACLAAVRERRPELLVLDYSLPDMRADDLIGAGSLLPPFIIVTGRGDEATAVRLMRAGARDYVIKDSSFLDDLPLVAARVLREIDTERSLADARASLEARLREKDAMLMEIHHRVKNNLQIVSSLVRLQIPPDADDRLGGVLFDLQGRITAMALIHEALYESENLGQVDFSQYLESLARHLEAAFAPRDRGFRIECRGDPFELPIDRAVPLGLIANELLTNSIKHAFPAGWRGEARIGARTGRTEGGAPFLEIEDNGAGLPDAPEAGDGGSDSPRLGLKLAALLAEQLGAKLSRAAGGAGGGTGWRIELPARGPKGA